MTTKTTAAQRKKEMRQALDLLGDLVKLEATIDYMLASKAKQTELDGASKDDKE